MLLVLFGIIGYLMKREGFHFELRAVGKQRKLHFSAISEQLWIAPETSGNAPNYFEPRTPPSPTSDVGLPIPSAKSA